MKKRILDVIRHNANIISKADEYDRIWKEKEAMFSQTILGQLRAYYPMWLYTEIRSLNIECSRKSLCRLHRKRK
jgi:hypothetical protein